MAESGTLGLNNVAFFAFGVLLGVVLLGVVLLLGVAFGVDSVRMAMGPEETPPLALLLMGVAGMAKTVSVTLRLWNSFQ